MAAPEAVPETSRRGIARAVFWGLLLCLPVCYWNMWQNSGTIYSMIFSTMGALIVLIAANGLLHKLAPRAAFTTGEMVVIFGIVSVASAIAGEWVFLNMTYVHVFAGFSDRDPTYSQHFLPNVPEILYFKDPNDVRDYIAGGQGFWYFLSRFDLWAPKIAMWTLLYGAITIALLSVNMLMRDAWLRRERLSFPIVQLPVAMMENDGRGPIWRSRAMWIAFAVVFAVDILNGLNYLYPNLPAIPTKELLHDLRQVWTEQPLRSIGFTPIALFPFIIAFALFMPNDLLFSVVFFFIVRKVILVVLAMYGIPGDSFSGGYLTPAPPYFTEQTWGAIIGLFTTAIWISRNYLKEVWADILSGAPAKDGGASHRFSAILFLFSFGIFAAFLSLTDLPWWLFAPYFFAFVLFSFVLTRMRAQLGPPTHEFAFFGPNQLLMNFYGTRNISPNTAVILGTPLLGINRLSRSHVMPVQLEAMKMADMNGVSQKRMYKLLALALVVGIFVGSFWYVQKGYVKGADPGWGDPKAILEGVQTKSQGPSLIGMSMVFVGFAVVTLLDVVRFRVPAFPLHPVGYALSMNFGVDYYWFGLIVALAVKTAVQRYYGLRGYKQLRNVAFGVLIAEYSAEMIWAVMALTTRQSTYTIGFNERGIGGQ
jgi:hypothetical protein